MTKDHPVSHTRARILAGLMEYKQSNTFNTVAFTSYGLFWWSLILLLMLPTSTLFIGIQRARYAPTGEAMAAYFFMWGLFTFIMYFGTLQVNRAVQSIFLSLSILFFLLTIGELTGSHEIILIAGYEGIFCGFSAIYTAFAEVLNTLYGKTILPLFPTHNTQYNSNTS